LNGAGIVGDSAYRATVVTFGTGSGDARHLPRGSALRHRAAHRIHQERSMKSTAALLVSLLVLLPAGADAAALTVTIEDIEVGSGHLMILVEASAEGWNGREVEAARISLPARQGSVSHVFDGLAPGDYAVQVLHDENDNGDLDSFLGIPTEGYGFSRNPRVMRRARFDEASFDLGTEGTTVVIQLR
jgi:uncharacterized protein (DUF2141 family)